MAVLSFLAVSFSTALSTIIRWQRPALMVCLIASAMLCALREPALSACAEDYLPDARFLSIGTMFHGYLASKVTQYF